MKGILAFLGAFLLGLFLPLISAHAQSSTAPKFIVSGLTYTGKDVIEYDITGLVSNQMSLKTKDGLETISCSWGPNLSNVASIKSGPDVVTLNLLDSQGAIVKKLVVGAEWKVVSLIGFDVDHNGMCDLFSFGVDGKVTLYKNPAIDGSSSVIAQLPNHANYDIAIKGNEHVGYVYYGPGAAAAKAARKVAKKKSPKKPVSTAVIVTITDLSGSSINRLRYQRGKANSVRALDAASDGASFAIIGTGTVNVINQTGAVLGTYAVNKTAQVFIADVLGKGSLQIVTADDSGAHVIDPKANLVQDFHFQLGTEAPPAPVDPTPTPTPGSSGGLDGVPPQFVQCVNLLKQVNALFNQGRYSEIPPLVDQMKAIPGCMDYIQNAQQTGDPSGTPTPDPYTGRMPVQFPDGLGLSGTADYQFTSNINQLRDGTGNGEGPCETFLNPIDGYKRGFTLKNSDAHHGEVALLLPGGMFTWHDRILNAKTFKTISMFEDNGYNFPDSHGLRHLLRLRTSVRGMGGQIVASDSVDTGHTVCWKIPKGQNRVD